ncbi:hypothetical protein [Tateyamaria sp. ANG-S1]|uniref:hypothetical protein n=1 Tax=Tateyamaria sp. ANG-S1 TaxID=1577905 RepID=UPI00057D96CC|nr:hypothetical protein [Tateyamaria sp. ANG-S1]KIC48492.1 hypothetical protein RA29_12155 [Tateyamaria sp. ANG-S1]
MDNNEGMISCTIGCWLVALLGGALAAVLLMVLGGWSFMQGAFMGLVVAVVAGALLSWIMCKPLPAIGEATAEAKSTEPAPAAKVTPAAAPATTSAASPEIKPSASLPGEEDLAARKGEWKYEAEPEVKEKPKDKPKGKPVAKKKAAPKADAPAAAGEGTKPETLSAAREGGPDNLKEIKGVGPKLEALLHSMGFYHFDQVASWGADEVAWVDQNLEGFKGRVTRDDWVAQAKILAAGGDTEFSKKVDKGGVY